MARPNLTEITEAAAKALLADDLKYTQLEKKIQ